MQQVDDTALAVLRRAGVEGDLALVEIELASHVGVPGQRGGRRVRLHVGAEPGGAPAHARGLPGVSASGCGARLRRLFATRPAIVEVGCWAHARRYFKEALPTASVACAHVLVAIGELYGLAARSHGAAAGRGGARGHAPAAGAADPRAAARPARGATRHGAAEESARRRCRLRAPQLGGAHALPRGRPAQDRQQRCRERASPDRAGSKNWLFAGSEAAAHRAAILCSLVQRCRNQGLNPFAYLRDLLDRVSTHPARRILELTPREWKGLRDARAQAAA